MRLRQWEARLLWTKAKAEKKANLLLWELQNHDKTAEIQSEIEKLKEEHGEGWSEYLMSLRDDVDELDRLDIE